MHLKAVFFVFVIIKRFQFINGKLVKFVEVFPPFVPAAKLCVKVCVCNIAAHCGCNVKSAHSKHVYPVARYCAEGGGYAFSNKMNMLTDDCRMYALKLTSDERFAENFLNPPHSAEAHFELGKIVSRLRREMNLVDKFFVYIKSEDVIINSLGNVSSPEHYYDVFYSNSDMNYEKWHDEFLNKKHSGFYVFDNNAEKKVEKMAKLCYVLPLDRLYKKDITLFTQIDSSRYENELAKLGADTETSVLIYDESGKSYFSMGSRIPADKQLKAGKEIKDFYEIEINGEKVVMYVNSSAFAAWNYAFVTPYSVFWADLSDVSRRKRVYKRAGEPSVPFCEKGGARKRADVFLHRKTEQSELCSDVVAELGFEN